MAANQAGLPQVTGVIWWEMMLSHYQGLYRRARSGESPTGYTRDFLQGPQAISDKLRTMFRGAEPPYGPITYRWPGGAFAGGQIYRAADYDDNRRVDVGQWTGVGAPRPWSIGDPGSDPVVTLEGSLEPSIPEGATAQWERLSEQRPWLVMVQLDWSQTELHLRAYLDAPPPHLSEAAFARVPGALRSLMQKRGGLVLGHGLPDLWFDAGDLRDPWRLAPRAASTPPSQDGGDGGGGAGGGDGDAEYGKAYEEADEEASSASIDPFEVDPSERDRSTRLHAATQNALSAAVRARGCEPRSPTREPYYDVSWTEDDGTRIVAEIKSVKATNSERQLRLGLGQVLRYRHLLESAGDDVRAVLVLSGPPHDPRWVELCAAHDVGLIWMPDLGPRLDSWLDV
jgi:hypothetical protein